MDPKRQTMPREEAIEQGLSVLREGYVYIPNRTHSFQSNVFETRLLGQKAICMSGEEAAEVFYDNDKFLRQGAAPGRVEKTLTGEDAVQSLDGEAHHHRKAMFMNQMNKNQLEKMQSIIIEEWDAAVESWLEEEQIELYEETKEILMRAVCRWAGVPLKEEEVSKRTRHMSDMYETPMTFGWRHYQGRKARRLSEAWNSGLVEKVRNGELNPPSTSVLYQFSLHKDLKGDLLDKYTAAVEILNILRPTVAVSVYINFIAVSLNHHPQEKDKLHSGDESALENFVQEVRRFYPFFPFNAAKVKEDFVWNGFKFEKGTLTLLDFYGTNHDSNLWDNPDLFLPDRFKDRDPTKFDLIPQGGGDFHTGHRCPGEWMTIDIMKISLDYLANKISYTVPPQDLSFTLTRAPSISNSGFIMEDIKRKNKIE